MTAIKKIKATADAANKRQQADCCRTASSGNEHAASVRREKIVCHPLHADSTP
ncbi:hypothetical protein [Azonexus hydrophilus]